MATHAKAARAREAEPTRLVQPPATPSALSFQLGQPDTLNSSAVLSPRDQILRCDCDTAVCDCDTAVSKRVLAYAAELRKSNEHILHLQLLRLLAHLDVEQEERMRRFDKELLNAVRDFEAKQADDSTAVELVSRMQNFEHASISRLVSHLHQTVQIEIKNLGRKAAAVQAELPPDGYSCAVDGIGSVPAVKRREEARSRVVFVLERLCVTLDCATELMDCESNRQQHLPQLKLVADVAATMHKQSVPVAINEPRSEGKPGALMMHTLSQVLALAARVCDGHNWRHQDSKWDKLRALAAGMLTQRTELFNACQSDRDVFIDQRRAAGCQLDLVRQSEEWFQELVGGVDDRPGKSLLSTLLEQYTDSRPKLRDFIIKNSDYRKMQAIAEFDKRWGGAGEDPELVQLKHECDDLEAAWKVHDDKVCPLSHRMKTNGVALICFCSN
jgi:hypothetical protein